MIRAAFRDVGTSEEVMAPWLSLFGRLGRAEVVAEATVWLCSDGASIVAGDALAVDAGYLVR